MKKAIVLIGLLAVCMWAFAQSEDNRTLFTVDNVEVPVSEFVYIYQKTNGNEADFKEESLTSYLELYKKFKLKVRRAKDMGLDEDKQLQRELDGYRRQLANTYLLDRQVTEKLVKEAYDRSKEEVQVSHIMTKISKKGTPEDTLKAYQKIMQAKKELEAGGDFGKLALKYSDHSPTKKRSGDLGYFTALQLPNMYDFESAAYNTPVGKITGPIRTASAYHLVMPTRRRPARGEIDVAHILIRVPEKATDEDKAAAKTKIDALYAQLKAGADFATLAKANSQDKESGAKGGVVQRFGINTYEQAFEDAAFNLQKDGDMTMPVLSSLGWHVIKRIGKKDLNEYDTEKPALLSKVKRDARFNIAKNAMIESIKKAGNFSYDDAVKKALLDGLTEKFFEADWKAPKSDADKTLFSLGGEATKLSAFYTYLEKNRSSRMRLRRKGVAAAADELINTFVGEESMKYEKSQLGNKYPEFRALMREYEEGILLFEATKREVWDKASTDEEGLKAYYEANKTDYKWDSRAKITTYTINSTNSKVVAKAKRLAGKKAPSVVLAKLNRKGDLVSVAESTAEKGSNDAYKDLAWKVGKTSNPVTTKENKTTFVRIDEVLPPEQKPFDKARGYVVADYQDKLEKTWVAELAKQYQIKIDQDVFKSLMK